MSERLQSGEVWKYPLVITDDQEIVMPKDAELLYVAEQLGSLCLWARVIPSGVVVGRLILMRGTGHLIGTQPYVGTVLTHGDALVWHVFDGGETPRR